MRARLVVCWIISYVFLASPALLRADEVRLSSLPAQPAFTVSDAIEPLARQYATPKAIADFLHRHFTFMRDQDLFGEIEYWQAPEEFLTRRAGDCEDYALMARELLVRNGIEAHVFSLFGEEGYAHTVCVFADERGRYNVMNQDKLRYYRAPTLETLASQMYPGWTFGGITERTGIRGRLVKEITNPHPASTLAALYALPASGLNR